MTSPSYSSTRPNSPAKSGEAYRADHQPPHRPTYHRNIRTVPAVDSDGPPRCELFHLPNRDCPGSQKHHRKLVHANELGATCNEWDRKCEWLEPWRKCGWWGDTLRRDPCRGGYTKRLEDCIKEGAPGK